MKLGQQLEATGLNELTSPPKLCCNSLEQVIQIVRHIPMAITITDLKGGILYCNESFHEMTGYSLAEVQSKNPSILSYKTTPPEVYTKLWQSISVGRVWQGKLVNKRKNNERYLADVKIVPLKDKADNIVFYLGMQKDVSDSHIIKAEHSNQEKTISAILNTIPSALALINSKQEVLLDNLAYKTLATDYRQEPAGLIIQHIKDQLHLDDSHDLAHMPEVLNKRITIELPTRKTKRWFACRLQHLEVSDIGIDDYFNPTTSALLLLTITEITREKIKDERQRISDLQTMTAETEMLHAMQETMHAVLHQLHAPVNMIASAVNLIDEQDAKHLGIHQAMEMALSAGNDALAQLRNALPERSPEAQQLTNINQVVHELSQMTMHKLLQHSVELKLNLTATLPSINAQPSRLRVAFKKLLDNAIDAIVFHQRAIREIVISTQMEYGGIRVIFEDSGIGIPKEQRMKVFQPFYSTKPYDMAGTRGIGLTIVQQIMNEHSGTIELKTSALGGTRVCVFLPKREGA